VKKISHLFGLLLAIKLIALYPINLSKIIIEDVQNSWYDCVTYPLRNRG
jgi:hypothetical protein